MTVWQSRRKPPYQYLELSMCTYCIGLGLGLGLDSLAESHHTINVLLLDTKLGTSQQ